MITYTVVNLETGAEGEYGTLLAAYQSITKPKLSIRHVQAHILNYGSVSFDTHNGESFAIERDYDGVYNA